MNKFISEEIQRIKLLSKYDNSKTLSEQVDAAWTKYPCVVNHPNATKTADSSGGVVYLIDGVYYYGNGRKMLADRTMANFTCNDAEFKGVTTGNAQKTPPTIPTELKDENGVKSFQDWLDLNVSGWATGLPDGKLNKAGGYGRFGPRTSKAWNNQTNKDAYLKTIQK